MIPFTTQAITILILSCLLSNHGSYAQTDFKVLRLTETPIFMDTDTLTEADINDEELVILQMLAERCVQRWNLERPIKYTDGMSKPRKLDDYYRQYLAAYSKSGDKLVWINLIKKSAVTELPYELYIFTDNEHYSNWWVDLHRGVILN